MFNYAEALTHLMDGKRVRRTGWNGNKSGMKDMIITRQKGYPEGIPINKNTSEAYGIPEGEKMIFAPYLQLMVKDLSDGVEIPYTCYMWNPSNADQLAEDWELAE